MFCPFINYEKKLAKILIERNISVSTAESCTGGLISSLLTDISGSSSFVLANFVTYSNEAKMKYLNVNKNTLNTYGAVSMEVAKEMAEGLANQTGTDIAVSITGIAGPLGGSKEKPVGLAYSGFKYNEKNVVEKILVPHFLPRRFIKFCFAKYTLYRLLKLLKRS